MKTYLSMEVPAQLLDCVDPLIDGHFVIATELLKNEAYFDWFKAYGRKPKEKRNFIMLDNGAYEAETVSSAELIRLAGEIHADLVWAPDTLYNGPKSRMQTQEFLEMCINYPQPFQIGIIPQGGCAKELIDNYIFFKMNYDKVFHWVGLSFKNDREDVVGFIQEPVHYLGLRDLEEIKSWPSNVISMDTVKPIKAAKFGVNLENLERGLGIWDSHMTLEDPALMYRNIAKLHAALTR